jgi:uncharacterized protein YraI
MISGKQVILAAAVGLFALPGIAAAQSAWVVTDLNMRSGPGPQYDVRGVIPANQSVRVEGCTESLSWCRVNHDGRAGWVFADYLQHEVGGNRVVTREAPRAQIPTVQYESTVGLGGGASAGAVGGAISGALIGGPIGAVIGGVAGAAVGGAVTPPGNVVTYVRERQTTPVFLEGEVVVGARLPANVTLQPIPDYEYHYAYVNRQPVLVDPGTRTIVYIER